MMLWVIAAISSGRTAAPPQRRMPTMPHMSGRLREDVAVDADELGGGALPGELLDVCEAAFDESATERRIGEHGGAVPGQRLRVLGIGRESRVTDDVAEGTRARADDGRARGHGLEGGPA